MRASQIYLILLPVLGMAQAAAVPNVEQSDMVVRRAPIEDYGFEIAALDTRDAEPEAVPIPVDETGLVLSEHGIEKRQAQAVFFAAARIVLRRVLPRVIRAIVRILENNAKRRSFIRQTVVDAGNDAQLQGRQGVSICDSRPMGANYRPEDYAPTKTNVAGTDYYCFILPSPIQYFRSGEGGDINWGYAPFGGISCQQADMGSGITRLRCGNVPNPAPARINFSAGAAETING
ncbi:hypothetical protein GTA08_BOTSDO08337 [Botryosphaeria dothidea]|uniref:Uncharacterized protein n=1 Tax=Botryosphaeria dothidea TaxID=55169 RepID=A0A8H4IN77_9PEZI|nr:hypothetical protein GTA08_BOTSDO08337 [Botryosphaeria dothidea]